MFWALHPADLAEAVGQSPPPVLECHHLLGPAPAALSTRPRDPSPTFASCTEPSTKRLLYEGSWTWPEWNSAQAFEERLGYPDGQDGTAGLGRGLCRASGLFPVVMGPE